MNPLVSVLVPAFNHGKFIAEALNSILNQETSINYEILIGEDGSNDQTRRICKEFADKHPEKIRLFLNNRQDVIYINGNPTGRANILKLLSNASGKYCAILEGDDYWSDTRKLTKQVETLESNPDAVITGHGYNNVDEQGTVIGRVSKKAGALPFESVAQGEHIQTVTAMFKKPNLTPEFINMFKTVPMGDFALFMSLKDEGNIRFMEDNMSCRRVLSSGYYSSKRATAKYSMFADTADIIDRYYDNNIHKDLAIGKLNAKFAQFTSKEYRQKNWLSKFGIATSLILGYTRVTMVWRKSPVKFYSIKDVLFWWFRRRNT